jgi:thiol:disulfide interchange protein DsbD
MIYRLFSHFRIALLLALIIPVLPAHAESGLLNDLGLGGEDDILDVDDAFVLSTEITDAGFVARWTIADGHYLYRDKMAISTDDAAVIAGSLQLSEAEPKQDPVFNKLLHVYHHDAVVTLPLTILHGDTDAVFKVKYQGCSEVAGICYPPQTRSISVHLPLIKAANAATALPTPASAASSTTEIAPTKTGANQAQMSEQDRIAGTLKQGNTWLVLLVFYGAGLLLAFTPCVFPMIPILMGIIVGQGEKQTARSSFGLSLVYVLAMALTYTVVGVLVGLSGENIQAWFQNPWIIGAFAAIFVALSLSMFGFYELQMPSSIQSKLTSISNSQRGGTLVGTGIMGFLSALIVGPCVTAPLVGALIYIADTGDAVLGGMALFSLSIGMGTPLLAIGASAGTLLPRAGAWMDTVKAVFGVLLLGLAIWMLERVAPAAITIALWAALIIVSGVYMGAVDAIPSGASGWRKLWKGLGLLLLVYGIILIIGLAAGGRDLFRPLAAINVSGGGVNSEQTAPHLAFRQIKGVDGLNAALADAKNRQKPVMLDFYADWCVSCKEMEALSFADPAVQTALADAVLLQADVTPNDDKDRALYKHFGIIGPPSIMFFDATGKELRNYRVVGYMPPDRFSQHIERAFH